MILRKKRRINYAKLKIKKHLDEIKVLLQEITILKKELKEKELKFLNENVKKKIRPVVEITFKKGAE